MLTWDILSSPYVRFLQTTKFNPFLSVSKLFLDFTILHIFQTRVISLAKFIQISICDVSCLKV